jgi:hypothetical protein
MAFAFQRGLIASSQHKVILRTSLQEAAYGATLLLLLMLNGARESEKKQTTMVLLDIYSDSAVGMTAGLMAFFIIILVFVGLAYLVAIPICVANIAQKQGRSAIGWFFLSILINPFFALLVLIALGDTDTKRLERAMDEERARDSVRKHAVNSQQNTDKNQQTPDHSRYMPH